MNTLQTLESSRNLTKTRLLGFPEWFDKNEWEVHEYMKGGAMCKEKSLTIDFFECISFYKYEKHPIKNLWLIQGITKDKIITLKRKIQNKLLYQQNSSPLTLQELKEVIEALHEIRGKRRVDCEAFFNLKYYEYKSL